MICVCTSVIATELLTNMVFGKSIKIGKSIKTPFFRFQRRSKQMDRYPLNTKFFKNVLFDHKTLINFKNYLKISPSRDP